MARRSVTVRKKKRAAPATGKGTPIGLRLEPATLARVDRWAASQQARGFTLEQSRQTISNLVDGQATALATGSVFVTAAIVFAAAASIVWLAPRPKHAVAAGHAH